MTEQGYRRGRAGRPAAPRAPRQAWPGAFEPVDDAELPPWAGLASPPQARTRGTDGTGAGGPPPDPRTPPEPGSEPRRGGRRRGRAAAARKRRSRRRLVLLAGVLVAAVATAAVIYEVSLPAPAHPRYVEKLQRGEFSAVPDACKAVSAATLGQYLPGRRTFFRPLAGGTTSECTFTVDQKSLFRVLDVTEQAYQPFLAVPGNGSATDNAAASYAQARQALRAPGRRAAAPPAVITALSDLGDAALSGLQVFRLGSATTDIVTVLVRERNVVITVKLQAQVGKGFSPTPVTGLSGGAAAVAREVVAAVQREPAVS